MGSREVFIMAAPLEPVEVGAEFDGLPPHITVVPPFTLETDRLQELHTSMEGVLYDWGPIRVIVGGEESYGDNGEKTAKWVSGVMFGVHVGATTAVTRCGGTFDERYIGYSWSPHITRHEDVETGARYCIPVLPLFVGRNGLWVVHTIYHTPNCDEETAALWRRGV
ncbi:MAG: hypothetical protein WBB39_04605 [Candidatus Saccharimonadales bacterium]